MGPRTALAVISTLSVDMIYQAVLGEQAAIFSQVPGIGSKTAQKIVLYLHDKLKPLEAGLLGAARDVNRELMDALAGLGYRVIEAQTAIQALPKDCAGGPGRTAAAGFEILHALKARIKNLCAKIYRLLS